MDVQQSDVGNNLYEAQSYAMRCADDSLRASAYRADSVRLRTFNHDALSALRARDEFLYDRPPPPPSPWELFRQWLLQNVLRPLFSQEVSAAIEYAIYALSVALIVFLALKLTRTDLRGLFYGAKKLNNIEFREEELLSADDLSNRIEEAISKREYRRAVRYLFLRALKELAAKNLIAWRIDKTNRDYVRELGRADLKTPLADLARLFEYVWYGNFELNETSFAQAKRAFDDFTLKLRSQ